MVVGLNTELSNSFVGAVEKKPEVLVDRAEIGETDVEQNATAYALDRKAVWGLYCVYMIIGIVNGFFATYFNTPTICQYVFGPMGDGPGDHTTAAQCNVAGTVYQMSWNFKLFFGIFLDVVPFFGSRRKGWMIFGWTGGLIMLGIVAFLVDDLVEQHQFETYLYLMMGMCVFSTFSDVAGDGMIIEMSKFETDDRKGHILTTCQMLRFLMMMISTGLGTLFMSGKSYQPPGKPIPGALILPFELSFGGMHWLLLGVSIPCYIGMVLWLKDPPTPHGHESGCQGFKTAGTRMWTALKSFAIFMLLVQCYGMMSVASLVNPANSQIGSIARPTNIQNGMGAFIGNLCFVLGVWIFRKFFLNKSWRSILFMTQSLVAICSGLAVMICYDTWGISRNGWFYMFQSNVPNFIQGIGQVVSSLAAIEVSPAGLEATVFELLTSASNGGIALSTSLQTSFGHLFQLDSINAETFFQPENTQEYANRLATATMFCLGVNLVGCAIFMWFLPKGPAQCREWVSKKSWHTHGAAVLNLVVFSLPFIYANGSVISMVASPPRD